MTDRYHAFTVVLETDIRSDDAEELLRAILMLKGVLSVNPHIADIDSHVARQRARAELVEKIWRVLKE